MRQYENSQSQSRPTSQQQTNVTQPQLPIQQQQQQRAVYPTNTSQSYKPYLPASMKSAEPERPQPHPTSYKDVNGGKDKNNERSDDGDDTYEKITGFKDIDIALMGENKRKLWGQVNPESMSKMEFRQIMLLQEIDKTGRNKLANLVYFVRADMKEKVLYYSRMDPVVIKHNAVKAMQGKFKKHTEGVESILFDFIDYKLSAYQKPYWDRK